MHLNLTRTLVQLSAVMGILLSSQAFATEKDLPPYQVVYVSVQANNPKEASEQILALLKESQASAIAVPDSARKTSIGYSFHLSLSPTQVPGLFEHLRPWQPEFDTYTSRHKITNGQVMVYVRISQARKGNDVNRLNTFETVVDLPEWRKNISERLADLGAKRIHLVKSSEENVRVDFYLPASQLGAWLKDELHFGPLELRSSGWKLEPQELLHIVHAAQSRPKDGLNRTDTLYLAQLNMNQNAEAAKTLADEIKFDLQKQGVTATQENSFASTPQPRPYLDFALGAPLTEKLLQSLLPHGVLQLDLRPRVATSPTNETAATADQLNWRVEFNYSLLSTRPLAPAPAKEVPLAPPAPAATPIPTPFAKPEETAVNPVPTPNTEPSVRREFIEELQVAGSLTQSQTDSSIEPFLSASSDTWFKIGKPRLGIRLRGLSLLPGNEITGAFSYFELSPRVAVAKNFFTELDELRIGPSFGLVSNSIWGQAYVMGANIEYIRPSPHFINYLFDWIPILNSPKDSVFDISYAPFSTKSAAPVSVIDAWFAERFYIRPYFFIAGQLHFLRIDANSDEAHLNPSIFLPELAVGASF
jgi:hypothetical protein